MQSHCEFVVCCGDPNGLQNETTTEGERCLPIGFIEDQCVFIRCQVWTNHSFRRRLLSAKDRGPAAIREMAKALKVVHTFKCWGGAFPAIFYKFIRNVLKLLFHNKKNNKKNAMIYV